MQVTMPIEPESAKRVGNALSGLTLYYPLIYATGEGRTRLVADVILGRHRGNASSVKVELMRVHRSGQDVPKFAVGQTLMANIGDLYFR